MKKEMSKLGFFIKENIRHNKKPRITRHKSQCILDGACDVQMTLTCGKVIQPPTSYDHIFVNRKMVYLGKVYNRFIYVSIKIVIYCTTYFKALHSLGKSFMLKSSTSFISSPKISTNLSSGTDF